MFVMNNMCTVFVSEVCGVDVAIKALKPARLDLNGQEENDFFSAAAATRIPSEGPGPKEDPFFSARRSNDNFLHDPEEADAMFVSAKDIDQKNASRAAAKKARKKAAAAKKACKQARRCTISHTIPLASF